MKKVKKFGRGGDIITGLGAVLVGKALYDKYKEGKDKDDSSGASLKKPKISEEVEKAQKGAPKPREEYVPADKKELDAKKAALSGGMRYKKPRGPAAQDVSGRKPVKAKDKAPATTSKPYPNPGKPNEDRPSKPYPTELGKPNEDRPSKPYPTEQAEANKVKNIPGVTVMKPSDKEIKDIKAKQAAAVRAKKNQGLIPYASSGREEIMRNNRFHKEAELGRGIKKGGMVKKYASGGSVSSASKRADGIAIRGKTRA